MFSGVNFKNEKWPRNGPPRHGFDCRPLNWPTLFAEPVSGHPGARGGPQKTLKPPGRFPTVLKISPFTRRLCVCGQPSPISGTPTGGPASARPCGPGGRLGPIAGLGGLEQQPVVLPRGVQHRRHLRGHVFLKNVLDVVRAIFMIC